MVPLFFLSSLALLHSSMIRVEAACSYSLFCGASKAARKQAAFERREEIEEAFKKDREVVDTLRQNAEGYLTGLLHWTSVWEQGNLESDILEVSDRVAQTKIREINFTLLTAKRSLQWLTFKYALNKPGAIWTPPRSFQEEDFAMVHGELMPKVKQKALMETEARKEAEAQYQEEPTPTRSVLLAYKDPFTPNLKGDLLTKLQLLTLQITRLFSSFDEAQRTWEIARLTTAYKDKTVLQEEAEFDEEDGCQRAAFVPSTIMPPNFVLLSSGTASSSGPQASSTDALMLGDIDVKVDGHSRGATSKNTIASCGNNTWPTTSTQTTHRLIDGKEVSPTDEELIQNARAKRVRVVDSNFAKDAQETKQVLALQANAVNAAKNEMKSMIVAANQEQTQQLVKLLIHMHGQQMDQLKGANLNAEELERKQTEAFAKLEESLAAIDVKIENVNGELQLIKETANEINSRVEKAVIKLDEMDKKLVEVGGKLDRMSWLQRVQNALGTTMFTAIIILAVIVLL
ncbi:unnamed protein product [Amoebophrya sp. A25]|nr:unnamed protein product [Amoebophrya sp. A25]|eukprot:GSA25T00013740001.1